MLPAEHEASSEGGRADTEEEGASTLDPRPRVRASDTEPTEEFPGARLLRRQSPEDVYGAISRADPLHLADRCARQLRAAHYLLDAERLHERALVRVAVAAMDYRGDPPLGEWLGRCIHAAIDDLLRQDREELRQGVPLLEEWDPRYEFLSFTLAIEPGATRRASVAFNGLADPERWAFLELLLHKRTLEELMEERGCTQDELIDWARTALEALYDVRLGKRRHTLQNKEEEENP